MRIGTALALASLLVAATVAVAVEPGFAAGRTTRVSLTSSGTPVSGAVQGGVLSRDARYAVFASNAAALPGANGQLQVYRHDRATGITELVSVNGAGAGAASGAFAPSVSADGRVVAFHSFSADLVAGDTNGALDVFVRDLAAGTTVAASVDPTGAFVAMGGSLAGFPGARVLSDDGRYVAFASAAAALAPGANGLAQAYVKDLHTGQVTRASVDGAGAAANAACMQVVLSGDGRSVAFQSAATNLSPLVTSGAAQVYVRDLGAGTTSLASLDASGAPRTFFSAGTPGLSRDGSVVVFETQAPLTAADADSSWDVYVRDLAAGTTTLASPSGSTAFGVDSRGPAISSDGVVVGFHSTDAMLISGDANGVTDVYLFTRATGALTLVSLNDDGVQGDRVSSAASLSADGTRVLFASLATNLVPVLATGVQLYVRDLAANSAPVVRLPAAVSLLEGEPLRLTGSFTDDDSSTSWTATVDWGDGVALPLALAAGGSFALDRLLAPGSHLVTVAVTDDGGATGAATVAVTVANVAPALAAPAAVDVYFGTELALAVSFSDPGSGETFDAAVDYGEGAGAVPVAVEPTSEGGRVRLGHRYAAAGEYALAVTVTDSNGGAATAHLTVRVHALRVIALEPVDGTFTVGRTWPVKFLVLAPDGSNVADTSVRVSVRNAAGAIVVGPYVYGDQPSRGVTVDEDGYHVNVDTRALAPGAYVLVVAFDSPALAGEQAVATTPTTAKRSR